MPKLPVLTGKKLIKVLQKFGYEVDRVHGSHHILRNNLGKKVTIPVHGNKDIPNGTLLAILYDLSISKEDFVAILKK